MGARTLKCLICMKFLSFSAAKKMGVTRYFTGNACPRGHIAERLVTTRACSECAAEKKRDWLAKNPDKSNAQKRNWTALNLEKVRALKSANQKLHREAANARNLRYAEKNRERLRAKNAAWAQANPGKCTAKATRRRSALLQRTPPWADHYLIEGMYELAQVFRRTGLEIDVDHIVPLQGKKVSGLHVHDNLQLIASRANKVKSNHFAAH